MDYSEEIVCRIPSAERDYAEVLSYLVSVSEDLGADLIVGEMDLSLGLEDQGIPVWSTRIDGEVDSSSIDALLKDHAVLSSRLKTPAAVVAKMQRFGEPLSAMLDVWGYRIVTSLDIDRVAHAVEQVWVTPSPEELLLRNGELQFAPRRDYRTKNHAGRAAFTSDRYDEAIHLNRRTPFGIVEVQILSTDLYARVVEQTGTEEHHDQFAKRRAEAFGGSPS